MRHLKGWCGAAVATMLLTAAWAPLASAGPPTGTDYVVVEPACEWVEGPDVIYRENDNTLHHRDFSFIAPLWFLVDGQYVRSGVVYTHYQVMNAKLDPQHPTVWGVENGTFEIRGASIGDFDGTWEWQLVTHNLHMVAQGVGTARGLHLKGVHTFGEEPTVKPFPNWCGGRPPENKPLIHLTVY